MKIVLLCCAFLVVACSHLCAAFPTEAEVKAQLKQGMTREEVIALFGQPGGHYTPVDDGTTSSSYLSPIGTANITRGRLCRVRRGVRKWAGCESGGTIRANPSYVSGIQMPRQFKWTWLIVGRADRWRVYLWLDSRDPIARSASTRSILHAYSTRKITRWRLPPDFRFITHDTTLQEVVERVGEYSRIVNLPVDEETAPGYAAVEIKPGSLSYRYIRIRPSLSGRGDPDAGVSVWAREQDSSRFLSATAG